MSIGLYTGITEERVVRNFFEMLERRGEPPPLPDHLISDWEWEWQNIRIAFGHVEEIFKRRYQVWRRKGYYWVEKRERLLAEEYRRRMDDFNTKHPSDDGWRAIHAWFCKERNKLQWERWRLADEAGARLIARDREKWARAQARRAKLRENRWLRWATDCADAIRRGLAAPVAPGQRRRTGAPIRRLCKSSINPAPSPEALAEAFAAARGRGRVEEKIRCGSMLLDLEAAVDSSLVRTETGEIVGRKPGLRGWIGDNRPGLLKHYASLMQYRRMAQAFREAHGLRDPHPASILLSDDGPRIFPQPLRRRFEAARAEAKTLLASPAGRTMKDLRQALARREWRRTG